LVKREIGLLGLLLIQVWSTPCYNVISDSPGILGRNQLTGVEQVVEENPEIELSIVEFGITGTIPGQIY